MFNSKKKKDNENKIDEEILKKYSKNNKNDESIKDEIKNNIDEKHIKNNNIDKIKDDVKRKNFEKELNKFMDDIDQYIKNPSKSEIKRGELMKYMTDKAHYFNEKYDIDLTVIDLDSLEDEDDKDDDNSCSSCKVKSSCPVYTEDDSDKEQPEDNTIYVTTKDEKGSNDYNKIIFSETALNTFIRNLSFYAIRCYVNNLINDRDQVDIAMKDLAKKTAEERMEENEEDSKWFIKEVLSLSNETDEE